MSERCGVARCRGAGEIVYLGHPICWRCWKRYAAEGQDNDAVRRALRIRA